MRLPLGWLREFVGTVPETGELCARLTAAGVEVEKVERTAPAFSGVVVADIIRVERHPNADRLNLCEVDPGDGTRLRIVCGAPNVRAGMKAPLARVGAKLGGLRNGDSMPAIDSLPPLEAAVIRGVRSEGMLCSGRELGLSEDHSGIVELDADAPVGIKLADYLQLEETVLDVAITPNRGDCLSILGLAREIGALFGLKPRIPKLDAGRRRARRGVEPARATVPAIAIEAPDLCPRYVGLAMVEVKVGPSPIWMRRRLELCGMRSISNVVDATNYVMIELGQPLHAFDLEKIEGGRIVARRAGNDRSFTTLDNATREIAASDLMIADGAKPLAIAGIMGGLNSEVGQHTGSILLESAYFEPMAIAKTARRLGLASEASYRFERGIDRAGQVRAIERAADIIARTAGATRASEAIDVEPQPAPAREIALDLARMDSLLGASIAPREARRRLVALGATVVSSGKRQFKVIAPPFRPDLKEWPDLAEEVARLSGLAEIPAAMPIRVSEAGGEDRRRTFIATTRDTLRGCGLTEVRTLAFAPADANRSFPGIAAAAPVTIANPLSAELGELRISLIPGLLAALRFNLNRQAQAFHAFETAKVFLTGTNGVSEAQRLAAVSHGESAFLGIGRPGVGANFYSLKGVLENLFESIGIDKKIEFVRIEPVEAQWLHPGKAARIVFEGASLGYLGELHPVEERRLELRMPCALFELDFGNLIAYGSTAQAPVTISPPPRFPAVTRDLALVLDRDFPADAAVKAIAEIDAPLLENVRLFDSYEGDPIPAGKKSLALSCRYRSPDRTLTDDEVNRTHTAVVEKVLARLGAELRR